MHGFRTDPERWIEAEPSLAGALVRWYLDRERPEDALLRRRRAEELFARQRADGLLGDSPAEAADTLIELRRIGEKVDSKRLQQAARRMVKVAVDSDGPILAPRVLLAAGRMNYRGQAVRESLRWYADHVQRWLAAERSDRAADLVQALYAGRQIEDVSQAILRITGWLAGTAWRTGVASGGNPWASLEVGAFMAHDAGRRLTERMLPFILRSQRDDGGWHGYYGQYTWLVIRALSFAKLWDEVIAAPPLPDDWSIARRLPVPGQDPSQVVCGGGLLWTLDWRDRQAIGAEPERGEVVRRVALPFIPGMVALGWWDDALALTCGWAGERRLLRIDPTDGQVRQAIPLDFCSQQVLTMVQNGPELLIGDALERCVWAFDPLRPGLRRRLALPGCSPLPLCLQDGSLWCLDLAAPILLRCTFDGHLLEWTGLPVDSYPRRFNVAFDGQSLWAFDGVGRQFLQLERLPPAS